MRKIINGKMYDTDTARLVATYHHGFHDDFEYFKETLHCKQNGEYFLCREGGPVSDYAISDENEILFAPLSIEKAKLWVEKRSTVETYIEEFGEPEE